MLTSVRAYGVWSRRTFALALATLPAAAKKRKKKRRGAADESLGVIGGSVFTADGFSLAGARVSARPEAEPDAEPIETVTDARGEFALRVPAAPEGARYLVRAEADGRKTAEKSADAYLGQKTSINLLLSKLPK